MQNSTLSKVNCRPLNSDQSDKALRSFITNEKDFGKSDRSMGKVTLGLSA